LKKFKISKKFFIIVIIIAVLFLAISAFVLILNGIIKSVGEGNIAKPNEVDGIEGVDCILVLGAGVREDGSPSHMLEDRLLQGIELYNNGVAPKIIMSGDHGSEEYDEVNVMKGFAVSKGVPSEDIFMDHAGFSTYESLYRAKHIFGCKKIVIVTQKYHLYRALYIAESLGIEAYGIPSDPRTYVGATYREFREIIARCKDFFYCILDIKPTYLGESISLNQSGDVTNDSDRK